MEDRDQAVLAERISGSTLREIAERHDLSAEGVRLVLIREGRKHVDQIVLAAWACQKTGGLLMLGVPAWADQDLAADYFAWVAGELRRRDDGRWKVAYRPTPDGSFVFALEDIDFVPREER